MIPVYEVRVWRGSLPSIFVTELPEEIYNYLINSGKEIMGGHMVESKTGKHLEVFIKGANGEAKKVYYLGQFD